VACPLERNVSGKAGRCSNVSPAPGRGLSVITGPIVTGIHTAFRDRKVVQCLHQEGARHVFFRTIKDGCRNFHEANGLVDVMAHDKIFSPTIHFVLSLCFIA
jgi:hypothetical protein